MISRAAAPARVVAGVLTMLGLATAAAPAAPAAVLAEPVGQRQVGEVSLTGLTSAQVQLLTFAAADRARSVRVGGWLEGDDLGTRTYTAGVLTRDAAQLRYTDTEGGVLQLRRVGRDLYLHFQVIGEDLDDVWAHVGPRHELYPFLVRETVISTLVRDRVTVWQPLRRAGAATVSGAPMATLRSSGSDGASVYVAATGPAYLRLVTSNDRTVRDVFSSWNGPSVPISAPPPGLVVPIDDFLDGADTGLPDLTELTGAARPGTPGITGPAGTTFGAPITPARLLAAVRGR